MANVIFLLVSHSYWIVKRVTLQKFCDQCCNILFTFVCVSVYTGGALIQAEPKAFGPAAVLWREGNSSCNHHRRVRAPEGHCQSSQSGLQRRGGCSTSLQDAFYFQSFHLHYARIFVVHHSICCSSAEWQKIPEWIKGAFLQAYWLFIQTFHNWAQDKFNTLPQDFS